MPNRVIEEPNPEKIDYTEFKSIEYPFLTSTLLDDSNIKFSSLNTEKATAKICAYSTDIKEILSAISTIETDISASADAVRKNLNELAKLVIEFSSRHQLVEEPNDNEGELLNGNHINFLPIF